MISSGSACIAANVFCRMPPASPRQPAWAAATTVPARSQSKTGRQSAVITAQAAVPVRSNDASASGVLPGTSAAGSTMLLWVWFR